MSVDSKKDLKSGGQGGRNESLPQQGQLDLGGIVNDLANAGEAPKVEAPTQPIQSTPQGGVVAAPVTEQPKISSAPAQTAPPVGRTAAAMASLRESETPPPASEGKPISIGRKAAPAPVVETAPEPAAVQNNATLFDNAPASTPVTTTSRPSEAVFGQKKYVPESEAAPVQAAPDPAAAADAEPPHPTVTQVDPLERERIPEVMPARVAEKGYLPSTTFADSFTQAKDKAKAKAGDEGGVGTALNDTLTGSMDVRLEEVSLSVDLVYRGYLETDSYLRNMMAGSVDHNQMVSNPAYAHQQIIAFFDKNTVMGLAEKMPTPDEASAHTRVVRVHIGPGTRIHPMVFAMWNADFDGDPMKVSFDPNAIQGAKSAMNFLFGTEGESKIDSGFFDMAIWKGGYEGVLEAITSFWDVDGDNPYGIQDHQVKGIAKGIVASFQGDTANGYKSMMMWAREIGIQAGNPANPNDPRKDFITGQIVNDIYRMNQDIRLMQTTFAGATDYAGPVLGEGEIMPDIDSTDGVTPPSKAANLYDYMRGIGSPKGTVEKKNQQFRISAGFAKAARRVFGNLSPMVGSDFIDDIALMMSGVEAYDESTRSVADEARRIVLKHVGLPTTNSPADWEDFMKRFTKHYNWAAYAVNSSAFKMNLDMTYAPYDNLSMPGIPALKKNAIEHRKAFRKQFRNVYGDISMLTLFGEKFCPNGYEKHKLEEFIIGNRIKVGNQGNENTGINDVKSFIGRLADMRTSFSREFDEKLAGKETDAGNHIPGALDNMMLGGRTKLWDVIRRRRDLRENGKDAFSMDPDVVMMSEALYLLGPDIFYFLGLDNPGAFGQTDFGRKFINARSADELGGLLYEAVVRYRLAPIQRYDKLLREATNGQERYDATVNLNHELNALESSSDTWGTIVREYRDGKNIMSEILFADIGKAKKDELLNKRVKADPLGRKQQYVYEIAAGLFAKPTGAYSRDRYSFDYGHTTLLNNLNAAEKKIEGFEKKSWSHYQDQVKTARGACKPGELNSFLNFINGRSSELVPFEPWMMVDAILSSLEKTYRSSEKSKQEAAVSYIYSAVSNLINGGTWSDLTVGGDFALGEIALDRFQSSPMIIAKLLSDPNFSITVYDGGKDILLSQEILFGKKHPTENEKWNWLIRHPRAAMALRTTSMANSVDKKTGFSYANATQSLAQTIKSVGSETIEGAFQNSALKALADKPGFYAMVALTAQMTGMKRSQLRKSTTESLGDLLGLLRGLDAMEVDITQFVRDMAESSGWDLSKIDEQYKRGMEQNENTTLVEYIRDTPDFQKGQLLAQLTKDMIKYSRIAGSIESEGMFDNEYLEPAKAATLFKLDDGSTLLSYYDVYQVMVSAKTQVSTAVNGAESRRNAVLMLIAQYTNSEPCIAAEPTPLDSTIFEENWDSYEGRKAYIASTKKWIAINETTYVDIIAQSGDAVLIEDPAACLDPLCACVRHATDDPSTNLEGMQTTAFGRMLTVVRTLSAEGLNLKSKTLGDDGRDSISKNDVFKQMWHSVQADINEKYQLEGLAAARLMLAHALQQNFENMGYEAELSLDDYTNVAQILMRPILNEAGEIERLKILSIGHLNSITKDALMKARSESKDGLTQDEAITIVIGALSDPEYLDGRLDPLSVLAGIKVHPTFPLSSGIDSQREGSIGRNIELVRKIIDESPKIGPKALEPLSDNELKDKMGILMGKYRSQIMGWEKVLSPTDDETGEFKNETYNIIGFVGHASDGITPVKDFTRAVGPRNAWIVEADSIHAAPAIIAAYKLGITVMLDGELDGSQWEQIFQGTGEIDEYQAIPVEDGRSMLPMFHIRLNGGNTTLKKGAFDAGVIHATDDNVVLYYENTLNEHSAGDSEFIKTKWFGRAMKPEKTGDYPVPIRAAFANMVRAIEAGENFREDKDILGFYNENRFLSNFWPAPVVLDGVTYPTVENAFQAAKTLDPAERVYFETCKPSEAKARGRQVALREDWNTARVRTMGDLVRQKFAPGTELAARLIATGNGYLEETNNHGDQFWGVAHGVGQNKLGKGLMKVRDEIAGPRTEAESRMPTVTIASMEQIKADFLDSYVASIAKDAPAEFDRKFMIDTGTIVEDGSREHKRLSEGMLAYLKRLETLPAFGNDEYMGPGDAILRSGRPDEIIGWLRAEHGDEVRYHPIRLFESGNDAGAPTSFDIESMVFNGDTQSLDISWKFSDTMDDKMFKLFEAGYAANKFIARAGEIADITMKNGLKVAGYVARQSTASRRLFMRRKQKMTTLMYVARMSPYGYNLAEDHEDRPSTFPENPELKLGLLENTLQIGDWNRILNDGANKVLFFPAEMTEMNELANDMAVKAVRYGVNPSVVFATYHNGVKKNLWFNFQILFEDGPEYQRRLMKLMHFMNPSLCPDGFTETNDTLFNNELQVLVPVDYTTQDGRRIVEDQWVDMYAGFHFLDEHYTGHSNAGARVATNSLPTMNTLMAGGKKLSKKMLDLYLDWANVGVGDRAAVSNWILPEKTENAS